VLMSEGDLLSTSRFEGLVVVDSMSKASLESQLAAVAVDIESIDLMGCARVHLL
jgi:hypothetical protein